MGMQLSGSLNLTGSLFVSGSTFQTGNNTLIGNTTLSGSIIISGSDNTATPTVKIYGDIQTDGVIKFTPVSKTINNSISASYIFVSGSTQDLYFSQNGNGFSNVTRLRWLEGNLYTGLLGGGVLSQINSTNYKINSGSGIIVNLNASTASIEPYPIINYIQWETLSSSIDAYSASYDQTFVGIGSNGQIVKQGTPFANGQFDTLINVGLVLHQNRSTINGVKTQPNLSYGVGNRVGVFTRAFGPLKIDGFILSGSGTQGIQVSAGTGFLQGGAYSYTPNNPDYVSDAGTTTSKIYRYHNSSSFTENVYDTNGGTGYTVLDPTQYSNNGTLTTVSGTNANNSQWTVQRVYWFPNSVAKAFIVYYGNAQYTSQTLALDGLQEEQFIEAPNTKANGVYLGALLLRKDFTWADTTTYKLVPGGLFRSVSTGGSGAVITGITTDISALNATTASFSAIVNQVLQTTASLNNYTASAIGIDTGLMAYTASLKAAAIVSSSQQIIDYNAFALTSSANVFFGKQSVSGALHVRDGITGSFLGNLNGTANFATYASTAAVTTNLVTNDTTLYPVFSQTAAPNTYVGLKSHESGSLYYNGVTRQLVMNDGGLVVSGSTMLSGSTTIIGTPQITGSLLVTGSITITSGSITMPHRPAFRVVGDGGATSTPTILSGSRTVVDYNQGNHWNNSTGEFTAPIAGLYQVNIVGRTNSNSSPGISQIIVEKRKASDSSTSTQIMVEWAANTTTNHIGGSTISKLEVGDKLYAWIGQGTISFDGNDNFSVAYIG